MSYEDIMGQQYFDIMGQCGPGIPTSALGQPMWPIQNGCLPYAQGGGYGPNPAQIQAMQLAAAAAANGNGMVPALPDAVGGPGGWGGGGPGWGGWGPWGAGCFGPPVAPNLIQKVDEPATFLRPRCPTRINTEFMGLPRTRIPACKSEVICCSVQDETKVIRIVFPDDVASQLLVDQIEIGREQLIQCGPVPAIMFTHDATNVETINTPTLQRGTSIKMRVTNTSSADLCLSVGLVVRTVRY